MIPLQTPPDLLTSTTGQLVQFGVLGVVCIIFAYAILRLWTANERIQQARVDDAKANNVASLDIATKAVAAITANTAATEAQTEATKELRDAIRRAP